MIRYRSGYKYQLAEPYSLPVWISPIQPIVTPFIALSERGNLYICAGYAWDGATWFPDLPSIMRASLVHDALYQLIRLGHLPEACRENADFMLWKTCLEDGMWPITAKGVLWAVRRFGAPAADPRNAKPILEAPR